MFSTTSGRLCALALLAGAACAAGCPDRGNPGGAPATARGTAPDRPNTGAPSNTGPAEAPAPTADELKQARQGVNELGFTLLARLAAGAPRENVVVSPYGVSSGLAPVLAAADGDTGRELADTLRFRGPVGSALPVFAALDRELAAQAPTDGKLTSARAVWARSTAKPTDPFRAALARADTPFAALDFAGQPAAAAGAVNKWAEAQTAGTVREVLTAEAAAKVSVLAAAAVYLKAEWAAPFRPTRTRAERWNAPGAKRDARMMIHSLTAAAGTADGTKVLTLPTAGGRVVVDFLLPAPDQAAHELAGKLTAERFAALLAAAKSQKVEVGLPSFRAKSDADLVGLLGRLGVRAAFGPEAAFPGFGPGPLSLSSVTQAAEVRVDEAGVVAAAVTTAAASVRSADDPPFEFFADRPFLFVVRLAGPGTVLFVGQVAAPDQVEK